MRIAEIELAQAERSTIDKFEKHIEKLFLDELFMPILKSFKLPKRSIQNVKSATPYVEQAIKSGQIAFFQGKFSGKFNSSISRELRKLGASYDRKSKSYKIRKEQIPSSLVSHIESSANQFKKQMASIDRKLAGISGQKILKKAKVSSFFSDLIYKAGDDLESKVKAITVAPKITKKSKERFIAEYTETTEKKIRGWTEAEVVRLRKEIAKRSKTGVRYQYYEEYIKKRYGVGQAKAKFIARQESNLAVAKFQEQKAREAGSKGYYWTTVIGTAAHPVREYHAKLNGKYFTWDKPPITSKDGRRNHPKEDFNCRCRARVVIVF